MTDYYPLLKRAVDGLEKSSGEARRALYERARTALVDQLRGMNPPLAESEITRERLALEEAVRKVEAEAARRMREPQPPPGPAAATPPGPPFGSAQRPLDAPAPPPGRMANDRPPPLPEEPRGFRDGVGEAQSPGDAHAGASDVYADSLPSGPAELDRPEVPGEPESLRPPPPGRPAGAPPPGPGRSADRSSAPPAPPLRRRPPPQRVERPEREGADQSRKGLIAAIAAVLVLVLFAGAAYWQRDRISSLFGVVRGIAPQAPREAGQPRPKIADRVGQDTPQDAARPGAPTARPGSSGPAVAQRVVLYEEDPSNPEGNRYVGSALWRTETISPGQGQPPDVAVRVDVEIPERRLAMTMSIRRNADTALPATHTVEIMFNLPADFAFGGVASVPGLLMKEAEQMRGAPLSGLAVKVTNNFFLIGLSAVEADLQRNLTLLKERSWFDIPVVYNNGRRAILAVEKGNPGERAFNDAFTTWKQ